METDKNTNSESEIKNSEEEEEEEEDEDDLSESDPMHWKNDIDWNPELREELHLQRQIDKNLKLEKEQQFKNKIIENKINADRMFDLAEKCIMMYMCQHFKLDEVEIFKNNIAMNNTEKPIILNPILEYSDKILAISLKIVPFDYVTKIPKEIENNEIIVSTIGFIYHSVITVYNAILNSNIVESAVPIFIKDSVHLELDDNSLTFYPVYLYPDRRQGLTYSQIKEGLEKAQNTISEEMKGSISEIHLATLDKVKARYNEVIDLIKNNTFCETTANDMEYETNKKLKTNIRIAIIFEELTKEELQIKYNFS